MSFLSELRAHIGKTLRVWRKDKYPSHNSASTGAYTIPENRPLSPEERALVEWLIENGGPETKDFAQQVAGLHVVARCSCGCPTVDLAVATAQVSTTGPSLILGDFLGSTPEGVEVGVTLHAREGAISELEIYPLSRTVGSLPKIGSLKRLE